MDGLTASAASCASTPARSPGAARTVRRYKKEVIRLLAEVSLGTGALVGHRRHRRRHRLPGLLHRHRGRACRATRRSTSSAPAAFTGFVSAYFNTREIAPLVAGLALAATVGCGFTAQLGAMRISEEVDALEVMGIPSLPFLVTTRMIAGLHRRHPALRDRPAVVVRRDRLIATGYFGQSKGTYDHYFHLFLPPGDVLWSFGKVMVFAVVIILIHCYYGYTASGGPGRRRHGRRQGGPHLDRGDQHRRLLPLPRHLGRHHHRADRGLARMLMTGALGAAASARRRVLRACTASCSCSSLALLVGVHGRDLQQDVRPRRARDAADRPGRQPARAAGRREAARADRRRGALGHLRRAQGAPSTSRCSRETVGLIPANVSRPAAAQDAVRREVRRPGAAGPAVAAAAVRGRRHPAGPLDHGHRARAGPRRPAAAAAHGPAGQAERHAQRAGHGAGGPGRAARATTSSSWTATSPGSTPSCPPSSRTSRGLADVVADLRRRRPRPGADAAQLRRDHEHHQGQVGGLRRASSPAPPGSPTTTRQLLEENDDRIIELAAVGRPTLELLARYSPEYPCVLAGADRSPTTSSARRSRTASCTSPSRSTQARARGTSPGEEPSLGRAPGAQLLRRCRTRRGRGRATTSGTAPTAPAPRTASSPASCVDPQSGLRRDRARSSRSSTPWWRRRWACRPTTCPTSPPCCSGRWPAGRRWGSREDASLADQAGRVHRRDGARHRPARRHHRQPALRRHHVLPGAVHRRDRPAEGRRRAHRRGAGRRGRRRRGGTTAATGRWPGSPSTSTPTARWRSAPARRSATATSSGSATSRSRREPARVARSPSTAPSRCGRPSRPSTSRSCSTASSRCSRR